MNLRIFILAVSAFSLLGIVALVFLVDRWPLGTTASTVYAEHAAAWWTRFIGLLGLVQLFVSGIGIIILLWTLKLTRELSAAENRAWLKCNISEQGKLSLIEDRYMAHFDLEIENLGRTVALDVRRKAKTVIESLETPSWGRPRWPEIKDLSRWTDNIRKIDCVFPNIPTADPDPENSGGWGSQTRPAGISHSVYLVVCVSYRLPWEKRGAPLHETEIVRQVVLSNGAQILHDDDFDRLSEDNQQSVFFVATDKQSTRVT